MAHRGPKMAQRGPKTAPKQLQDGSGTMSVAHDMSIPAGRTSSFSLSLSFFRRPRTGTPKEAPGTSQNGQPSQRLCYNMGCGGIRGASYNPPHPSGVHGVMEY